MNFDLTRGLHDLSRTPTVGPEVVPVDRVLTRVHRERALRTSAVTALSAAAVVGIAVAVQAVGTDEPPTPPAQTTTPPSPEPTPSAPPTPRPTPTSTPTAEQTETPAPPVTPPSIVAITPAGELVLLDPTTGERLSVVTDGLATEDYGKVRVTVDRDRTVAYISQSPEEEHSILRVSLTDGTTERVATGLMPSLSPDGRTLAFAGPDPADPEGPESWGLNLLDLATGEIRHLTEGPYDPARWVGQAEWAPDGRSLYVELGWAEGGEIVHVDLDTTTSLLEVEDAPLAPEEGQAHDDIQLLGDGRMVLASVERSYQPAPESHRFLVLDEGGTVVDEVDDLAGMLITDTASPVRGTSVAVLASQAVSPGDGWEPGGEILLWDGSTGVTRLSSETFLAIAW